jgi:ABC-type Fe3+ transport system permease subunit
MTRAEWFKSKWLWLKRFALAAALGVPLAVVGFATDLRGRAFVGLALAVPLFFWLNFIPILHWKDRYIGGASNVWGVFLAFETAGWSKLFYWFMHLLPDWRRSGQYAEAP